MITQDTKLVYVRVDVATRSIIAITDEKRYDRPGQPIFEVAANYSNLKYYVVIDDSTTPSGLNVRVATADEIAAIDAQVAKDRAAEIATYNLRLAEMVKKFYDDMFKSKFKNSIFITFDDIFSASAYTGKDLEMVTVVQPAAKTIQNALDEWRFNVCLPIVTEILKSTTVSPIKLDSAYTVATQQKLDTFLTNLDIDIATYNR